MPIEKHEKSKAALALAAWRGARKMTQAAAELDIDQATFSKLESGSMKPGRKLAVKLHRRTKGRVKVFEWDEDDAAASLGATG